VRLIVLTLLLANLLFLAWQYMLGENKPEAPQDAYQNVPSLELASQEVPEAAITDLEPLVEELEEIADPLMAQSDTPPVEIMTPDPETVPVATPSPGVCANLGPFDDENAALAAIDEFSLSSFNPVVNERQTLRVVYWVYIPPFRDRKSANLALNMLASRGIKDAYIVGSGEDMNAIALGLYSEEGRAKRRLEQMEETGMAARIGTLDRSSSLFFINVELPRLQDFDAKLLSASEHSSLSFASTDCEVEVTGEKADAN
jgi:hypothetical protein